MQRMLDIQKAQASGNEQVKFNPHTGTLSDRLDVKVANRPRVGSSEKIEIKDLGVKASVGLARNRLNVIFDDTVAAISGFRSSSGCNLARATDLILWNVAFEMVDHRGTLCLRGQSNQSPAI